MKILQVIDQLNPGGAERVCVNLTNVLYNNGYDVKILLINGKGPLLDVINKKIEVIFLDKKNKKRFKGYRDITKLIKGIDIVHIHVRKNYKYIRKALLFSGLKKKLILHDHYGRVAVKKKVPTFYRLISKPDFYIGCSKVLTDWAINNVKIKKDKVFMIKNFVIRENVNADIEKEKKGFVLVGNLRAVKNHIFAVKLAKETNKELTIYSLEIKDEYSINLFKQIEDMGMSDKIHFIYGCINIQKELPKYEYALLPSKYEGDSLALIEYLAQSIPFLCYDFGESVKIIKEKFPLFVLDSYKLNEWVNNVKQLKDINRKDIEEFYNNNYSEDILLDKYLNVYNKLLLVN